MKRERALIVLQANMRKYMARKEYLELRYAALTIQSSTYLSNLFIFMCNYVIFIYFYFYFSCTRCQLKTKGRGRSEADENQKREG